MIVERVENNGVQGWILLIKVGDEWSAGYILEWETKSTRDPHVSKKWERAVKLAHADFINYTNIQNEIHTIINATD